MNDTSNIGNIVNWPMKGLQKVVPPGKTSKKKSNTKPTEQTHWPEAPQQQENQNSNGSKKEKQIPNPGSSDGKGEIPVITDLSDLTPEQRETLRKILEELQKSQDLHLNKNTSPDAKNNQEEREQIRKTQNEIRKIARKEEEMKNRGRSLSDAWNRSDKPITLHKGEINWKQKLRQFFTPWTTRKTRPSFRTLNRRDQVVYPGGRAPAIRPGITRSDPGKQLKIIATVDTSGSVDDDMLASFFSEIKAIFTQHICEDNNIEVRVIDWTGGISTDVLLHSSDFSKHFSTLKRSGEGSTNFAVVKEYIIKKAYKPVAMVHFTDGDMHISQDMIYKENNCKNAIVLPNGMSSTIKICNKLFDMVIPMVVYQLDEN